MNKNTNVRGSGAEERNAPSASDNRGAPGLRVFVCSPRLLVPIPTTPDSTDPTTLPIASSDNPKTSDNRCSVLPTGVKSEEFIRKEDDHESPLPPPVACPHCGQLRAADEFCGSSWDGGGEPWCRWCRRVAYEQKNAGKQGYSNGKPPSDDPKVVAHEAVAFGKMHGALIPESCERCGSVENIHGHHDDYSQPFRVRWLCISCHVSLPRKRAPAPAGSLVDSRKARVSSIHGSAHLVGVSVPVSTGKVAARAAIANVKEAGR